MPETISAAVEEFLRHSSPIQIFGRHAARDITLHGQTITAGDVVALSFAADNHASDVFENPECVLNRVPNRNLPFGAGPHLCLGAPVARLEMAVTLGQFTRHIASGYTISAEAGVQWGQCGDRRGLA